MATYIKTLKEDNGDITYPQTTADAVLNTNGSSSQGGTLQTFLNNAVVAEELAATSTITPLVTNSMIDWSTMDAKKREWTGSIELSTTLSQFYEIDVSNFPTGANMMFIGMMHCNGTATEVGSYCGAVHGTQNGLVAGLVTTWGRTVTCFGMFTKEANQQYIIFKANKDNNTTCTCIRCGLYVWRVK